MAYKFKGIENDKNNLNYENSSKIQKPNLLYGSTYLRDPEEIVGKAMEEHGISRISLELILDRSQNDFEATTVVTLKQSIKQVGLLSPILLWQNSEKKYVLISGHRRVKAYREIIEELQEEIAKSKRELEETDAGDLERRLSLKEECEKLDKEIKKYKTIPAIIFEIVDESDSRLGTDPKYITRDIEKLMYEGSNMEARQISKGDLLKHIDYFYEMIKNDDKFRLELLTRSNEKKERKQPKLNLPKEISNIITKDLGFSVSSVHIYRYVYLKENEEKYPRYYKKCMERIKNGDKIRNVYEDFRKAVEIKEANIEDKNIKREYQNRIENGDEPIIDIYNECFNKKQATKEEKTTFNKDNVMSLLQQFAKQGKTLEQAIEEISKM